MLEERSMPCKVAVNCTNSDFILKYLYEKATSPESQMHKLDTARFPFNNGVFNITYKVSVSLQMSHFI